MSELFSWPTVTVGMRDPFVNGDRPAPGRGPGAGRFRLQVGTGITVALRAVHRTRTDPGRCPGPRQGGHPFGSVDVAVPGARAAGCFRPSPRAAPPTNG